MSTPPATDARQPFSGPQEWQNVLLQTLRLARQRHCDRIIWCDPGFADWPLGHTAVLDALEDWAARQHQLVLVATGFDTLVRRHPRFMAWRARRDDMVQGRKVTSQFARDTPSAIWTAAHAAWLTNPDRLTGIHGSDAALVSQIHETLGDWVEKRSVNGFPSTTLGL